MVGAAHCMDTVLSVGPTAVNCFTLPGQKAGVDTSDIMAQVTDQRLWRLVLPLTHLL